MYIQCVLQCVAVCCSVIEGWSLIQRLAIYVMCMCSVCCSVLQCVAVCCSVCCSVLQCVAVCCSVFEGVFSIQRIATCVTCIYIHVLYMYVYIYVYVYVYIYMYIRVRLGYKSVSHIRYHIYTLRAPWISLDSCRVVGDEN